MTHEEREADGWVLWWGLRNLEGAWLEAWRIRGDGEWVHQPKERSRWSLVADALSAAALQSVPCFPARFWRRRPRTLIGTWQGDPNYLCHHVYDAVHEAPQPRRFQVKIWEVKP